jgi:dynactin-4
MAALTPYTYIQCPCSDSSTIGRPSDANSPTSNEPDEDDRTFDPRAPRSNFSLYPLEYLLYCEDCHQIRCPRCVTEEIVTYYCPNCLFEVPSSNLKSEGNRLARPQLMHLPLVPLLTRLSCLDVPAAASNAQYALGLSP